MLLVAQMLLVGGIGGWDGRYDKIHCKIQLDTTAEFHLSLKWPHP